MTSSNRDPAYVGREDVKRTLRRWPHPNTQRKNRAVLVSFYDWAMEEGYRRDNPARQTRRPKAKPPKVYRLTRAEAAAFLAAAETVRERRIAHIGICAGARNRRAARAAGTSLPALGLGVDQRRHRQGWPAAMDPRAT